MKMKLKEEYVSMITELHKAAEELTKEWYPDTEKYPAQKRMSELALMKMFVDLITTVKL